MTDNTYYPWQPTYIPNPWDTIRLPPTPPTYIVPIVVPSANDAAWYQKEIDRLNKELDDLRRQMKG